MSNSSGAKLVVIGQGYVGLPLAVRAVEAGYNVVGIDFDQRRIDALNQGESYVEDISHDQLAAVIATSRYQATNDYALAANFDFAVITVPTPLKDSLPDLSYIESSGTSLAPYITRGATVILESTTYPGTTQELLVPVLEAGSGLVAGSDFYVGYSPERIDPGNQNFSFKTTPKIVSGIDAPRSRRSTACFQTSSIRPCRSALHARPRWPNYSRTLSATSTLPSLMSSLCLRTSWA
ncbi:nucleotide sugar dehydrogenase [Leucobacter coleopterorum]|uniref:nucleotide sugar dehydrogenase n=1 Tax=Leucobacter coleopterorum TaxID=2714933 RepID=UPI001FCC3FDA|nr:NAD(P)-binding domain-containing protein [Leucobacter coleopterorum]